VDKVGNRRKSTVDLRLPPENPLACVVSPKSLWADGKAAARVLCAGSDPKGRPIAGSHPPWLRPKLGRVESARQVEAGLWEWRYQSGKDPGKEVLEAGLSQQIGTEKIELELFQGPAAGLDIDVGDRVVHRGGTSQIMARVLDAQGRLRPQALMSVFPSRGAVLVSEVTPGIHRIELRMPTSEPEGAVELQITARGPQYPQMPAPSEVSSQVRFMVAPPLLVNVRLKVDGNAISAWAEDPEGRVVPDRKLFLSVDGKEVALEKAAEGKFRAKLARAFRSASVSDAETGVTAVAKGSH
jgi:hypothetical protein